MYNGCKILTFTRSLGVAVAKFASTTDCHQNHSLVVGSIRSKAEFKKKKKSSLHGLPGQVKWVPEEMCWGSGGIMLTTLPTER